MHQTVNTQLTVEQAAQVFRETGEKFITGYAKTLGALASIYGHQTNGFFTPDFSNDPFAALAEAPTFTIGVARAKYAIGGARTGEADAVHMYVFDGEDSRELDFYSPHGMFSTGAAVKRLALFVDAVRARDPHAQVGKPQ